MGHASPEKNEWGSASTSVSIEAPVVVSPEADPKSALDEGGNCFSDEVGVRLR